jgi:hypothetical protein
VVSDSDPERLLDKMRADHEGADAELTFERERALPGGSVEIVYRCSSADRAAL